MAKSKLLIAAEQRIAALEARLDVARQVYTTQRDELVMLRAQLSVRNERSERQHFGQRTVKRWTPAEASA